MTIYQVLCLIGVPALILAVFKYLWSQIKHNTDRVCLNELLTECIVQTLNIANLKNQKIMLAATEDYSLDGDYI